MFQDASGTWWMVGTQSGCWYRDDGHGWVASAPPGRPPTPALARAPVQPRLRHQDAVAHPVAHAVVIVVILVGLVVAVMTFFGVGGGSYELLQAMGFEDPSAASLVAAFLAAGACLVFTWRIVRGAAEDGAERRRSHAG